MPNPIDKLLGRDSSKKEDDDGLKEMFADARRRRGVPPEGYTSRNSDQNERDEISAFFSNHPFFGGRSPFGVGGGEGDSPASSLFENLMSHSQSSSYQIHQDGKEVTIDVDLPGVSAKELKVEVLQNIQSCVVSWSGQRKQRNSHNTDQQQYGRHPHQPSSSSSSFSSFNNRLRLGPQVDCDKLTANLSHGILTMKAPVKELQETATVRNVEVTEHEQN